MKTPLFAVVALIVLCTGCDLLDKNPAAVKAEVAAMQSALAGSNWAGVEGKLGPGFAWTDAAGKRHAGPSPFIASLKATGGGSATLTVSRVAKVAPGKYLALTEAKVGATAWQLRLIWQQQNGQWKLAEAKDLSARQGGSPAAIAAPAKSAAGQMAEEVGQAVDYGIGYTQLKTKKATKEKVNKLNDEHNQQLEDQLGK